MVNAFWEFMITIILVKPHSWWAFKLVFICLVSDRVWIARDFLLVSFWVNGKRKVFCKIVPGPDLEKCFFLNMSARKYKEFFFSLFHTFDFESLCPHEIIRIHNLITEIHKRNDISPVWKTRRRKGVNYKNTTKSHPMHLFRRCLNRIYFPLFISRKGPDPSPAFNTFVDIFS